jgi:glycosyltransferase involved in cell wall biosynthesis
VFTTHNERKGYDLLLKAFSEEFTKEENVKLFLKINTVYNPGDGFSRRASKHINKQGNTNIEYVDKDLSEEELVKLFCSAHVFVSPDRAEGFGINILNSLAVGTPVITTVATGKKDYCSEANVIPVVADREVWSKYNPVYERARWLEPSVASLRQQMRDSLTNYEEYKKICFEQSISIREKYSWSKVVDSMEQRLKSLYS